jgi:hypothetical protein
MAEVSLCFPSPRAPKSYTLKTCSACGDATAIVAAAARRKRGVVIVVGCCASLGVRLQHDRVVIVVMQGSGSSACVADYMYMVSMHGLLRLLRLLIRAQLIR